MAATTITSWIPIDKDRMVTGKEIRDSAIYRVARRRETRVRQTDVPRLTEADVDSGSTLTDDSNVADTVSMYVNQFVGKRTLDESEFEDAPQDTIEAATVAWVNTFHKRYDNASIGVTAARSATLSDSRPYTSIYNAVRSNDNSGAISYTANTNYTAGATGGMTFANISAGLAKVENNEFWDPESGVVLMHPGLISVLRDMVDGDNRHIFLESTAGFPGGTATNPDMPNYRLLNLPVVFTHGARTSPNYKTINGNRLLVFANRRYLVRGDRIPAQSRFIPASINTDALEHTIQFRARQGFVLTVPFAASVVEDLSASQ